MLRNFYTSFASHNLRKIGVPKKSKENPTAENIRKNTLARHRRCDVYCGARETVGGSSVSSGCWGEDSNHEK
jgi:hypothetical protein